MDVGSVGWLVIVALTVWIAAHSVAVRSFVGGRTILRRSHYTSGKLYCGAADIGESWYGNSFEQPANMYTGLFSTNRRLGKYPRIQEVY